MLVRLARLLAPAIALLLLVAPLAHADIEKLAKHLRKLDPGGKVGGKSIVGTKPKQELHGVHGKPNFIVALGDEETIHGASKNDQIGALGEGVKLVPSNHGHSLIVAGPDSEVVVPGEGHNLIVSHAKGATIILESPGDEVIANGPHDRIICAKHANHELIEVAKGEKVSKSCKGHHNEIEPPPKAVLSAYSSAAAHKSGVGIKPVTGSGTDTDPYVADCSDPERVDCTVDSFAWRQIHCPGINCFWGGENVPAYQCPRGHPYLLNQPYPPTALNHPNGVQLVIEDRVGFHIEVINHAIDSFIFTEFRTAINSAGSSVTNWADTVRSYRVILHCTSDPAHAYRL